MKYTRGRSMDSERIVNYIEASFLQSLLKDENVTDISYNGSSIYYLHNLEGRKLSDIQVSGGDAKDFVRQVANITEKQFSYQSPIVDVTAGKYRLNAVHNSIGRYKEEHSITFSLRIASIKVDLPAPFLPNYHSNFATMHFKINVFYDVRLL